MFDGLGLLEMEGDHLDISYRASDHWPSFTPLGSIHALAFNLGDPDVGPNIQLGALIDDPNEPLDWDHAIDPMHFHGSDQFRICLEGEWVLARTTKSRRDFSFQEAGRVYQEHPGPTERQWIFLTMADRRGNGTTLTRRGDRESIYLAGQYDESGIVDDPAAYPHPAGPKGTPAIATTIGKGDRGYLFGSFADDAVWPEPDGGRRTIAGVLGEEIAGPIVYLTRCEANQVVAPAATVGTEVLLVVVDGSCRVGDDEYARGDLRVQAADHPMDAVVAGPEGAEVALLIADRRVTPSLSGSDDDGQRWLDQLSGMRDGLLATTGS